MWSQVGSDIMLANFKVTEEKFQCLFKRRKVGSFPFVPPSLVGACYFHPPQTHVQFFYIEIYYVMTGTLQLAEHNVLRGEGGGGTNGKCPKRVEKILKFYPYRFTSDLTYRD